MAVPFTDIGKLREGYILLHNQEFYEEKRKFYEEL